MLRRLSLKDFVIVDALELEFGAGFSVLTGETGAGKSILVDALQLALGARAEGGVVREGRARSALEAVPCPAHGLRRYRHVPRERPRPFPWGRLSWSVIRARPPDIEVLQPRDDQPLVGRRRGRSGPPGVTAGRRVRAIAAGCSGVQAWACPISSVGMRSFPR